MGPIEPRCGGPPISPIVGTVRRTLDRIGAASARMSAGISGMAVRSRWHAGARGPGRGDVRDHRHDQPTEMAAPRSRSPSDRSRPAGSAPTPTGSRKPPAQPSSPPSTSPNSGGGPYTGGNPSPAGPPTLHRQIPIQPRRARLAIATTESHLDWTHRRTTAHQPRGQHKHSDPGRATKPNLIRDDEAVDSSGP
jgi:hypothetical protein